MQLTQTTLSHTSNSTYQNNEIAKQNVIQEDYTDNKTKENLDSIEPKTLKNMSLEEIEKYLLDNNIKDESNSRANDLYKLQKFADKIDSNTYTKMTNALLKEDTVSESSMRYSSFPSQEILDQNPQLFHAILETTLEIKDTAHSLIFSLNLKKDLSEFTSQQKDLGNDTDFSNESFIEFLMKKALEIEQNNKEHTFIQQYSTLANNLDSFLKEEITTIDLLV